MDRSKLQALILRSACAVEASDCDPVAQRIFAKWFNQSDPDANNPLVQCLEIVLASINADLQFEITVCPFHSSFRIPVNIRAAIYCHAIRKAGDRDSQLLQFMLERLNRAASSHEQVRIIDAFFCTLSDRDDGDSEEKDMHDDDDDTVFVDDDAKPRPDDANEQVEIEHLTDRHLSSLLPLLRQGIDSGTKSLLHVSAARKRLNNSARRALHIYVSSDVFLFVRRMFCWGTWRGYSCSRREPQRSDPPGSGN